MGDDPFPQTRHHRLSDRSLEMQAAYGFGLPSPLPDFMVGMEGDWRLTCRPGGIGNSYIASDCIDAPFHMLSRDGTPWMTDSLLELESHAWHFHRARGHVVIAGLGMGMFAHAVAARPDVLTVTVAEISQEVVALMARSMSPLNDKVRVLAMDAASTCFTSAVEERLRGSKPDYLYADIWPTYPDPGAPTWTRALVESLAPVEAGWWGQEAALAHHCEEEGIGIDLDAARAFMDNAGIPCVLSQGYITLCRDVALAHGIDHGYTGPFHG